MRLSTLSVVMRLSTLSVVMRLSTLSVVMIEHFECGDAIENVQ